MANFIQNAAAGILDIAALPTDILGLPIGVLTGLKAGLFDDDKTFAEGFADNPMFRASNAIREGVSDITGADDDSAVRMISSSVPDIMAFGGLTAAKLGGRAASRYAASKSAKEAGDMVAANLLKTAAKNNARMAGKKGLRALTNYSIATIPFTVGADLLMDAEPTESDRLFGTIGAAALATRGGKVLRKMAKTKIPKTETDVMREARQETIDKMGFPDTRKDSQTINDIHTARTYADNFAGEKGVMEELGILGLTDNMSEITKSNLSSSARDAVERSPLILDTVSAIDSISKLPVSIQESAINLMNNLGVLSTRIGNTRQSILESMKSAASQEITKRNYKGALSKMKEVAKNAGLDEFIDLDKIDKVKDLHGAIMSMNRDQWSKYGRKHGFVSGAMLNVDDKSLLDAIDADKALLGNNKLPGEMSSLLKRELDESYDAGLLSEKEYERLKKGLDTETYFPIREQMPSQDLTESHITNNIYRMERTGIPGIGVEKPQNTAKTTLFHIRTAKQNAVENIRKRQLIPAVANNMKRVRNELKKKYTYYANKASELKDERLARLAKAYRALYEEYKPIRFDLTEQELSKIKDRANLTVIDYFTPILDSSKKGQMRHALVPSRIAPLLLSREINTSKVSSILKASNNLFTQGITGKFVPTFLSKRYMYSLSEIYPAIRSVLKENGEDIKFLDILMRNLNDVKTNFQDKFYEAVADATAKEDWSVFKLFNKGQTPDEIRAKISQSFDDMNVSRVDPVGDLVGRTSVMDIELNPTSNISKIAAAAKQKWKTVDNMFFPKLLGILKSSIDDAAPKTIVSIVRDKFNDDEIRQKIIDEISMRTSDTRRRGFGKTFTGKVFNAIQDYMPYGSSAVQGLVGKARYLHPKRVYDDARLYIRDAIRTHDGINFNTATDIAYKMGSVLAELPDNVVFDMIWKAIVIPTFLCYAWNNMSAEQSNYYHSLAPYEKTNKFVLTNLLGDGVNLTIPIDQEWSVIKSLAESMIDGIFNLSANDYGNPAYSNRDQVLWAIKQDFGLALPVLGEAVVNLAGYQTNLDASVPFTNEQAIEEINKYRYKNLNPELAEVLMSVTGKLGKLLVNMAEDRSVMDYRNVIPFLSINPHTRKTSDTHNFLYKQMKLNPDNQLLKEWHINKAKKLQELNYFMKNGIKKNGEEYDLPRVEVIKKLRQEIADIDNYAYEQFTA